VKPKHQLELTVQAQTNNTTCGPTCLEAVYRYFGHELPLQQLVDEVVALPDGGTLAVWLACHALKRGFSAEIYTYNLNLFDPTWFTEDQDLVSCLQDQRRFKREHKLQLATDGYLEFLRLGGKLHFCELNAKLIRRILKQEIPILTGLSATYLYECAREHRDEYDAIRGTPTGHFVVVRGYNRAERTVSIADPLLDNPKYTSHHYDVRIDRLIGAILLGIITYDANLLIIQPGT
jgi:Peptidase C39 family